MSKKWATELHRMVGNHQGNFEWSKVIEHVRLHPDEAGVRGTVHLQTPLHIACYHYPPLEAVRALVEASPNTVALQNSENETALHLACGTASEEVVRFLLDADTLRVAVSLMDKYGDTPLHVAAQSGLSTEVLQQMALMDPSSITRPNTSGLSPFFSLGRSYERGRTLDEIQSDEGMLDDWERSLLFLRIAYYGTMEETRYRFRAVHAAVGTPCPHALFKAVCRFWPEQLEERDSSGATPLAIALRSPIFVQPRNGNDEDEEDTDRDSVRRRSDPTEFTSQADVISDRGQKDQSDDDFVVEHLLQICPQAGVLSDNEGRYPLCHSLARGRPWTKGFASLLRVAPQLMRITDPPTKLYPFQLAAADPPCDLQTIYELIRSCPDLIPSTSARFASQTLSDSPEQTLRPCPKKPRIGFSSG